MAEDRWKSLKDTFSPIEVSNFVLKELSGVIDRKVADEVSLRLKDYLDHRGAIELQIVELADRLRSGEKLSIEREQRLLE